MAANFLLKQHLLMSSNATIKNLVPENLSEIPLEETWKLGRIWFNTTIGKFQGVYKKLDKSTGLPVEPEAWEVNIIGADELGPTTDGEYWPDGLFDFTQDTKIADAMDDVNEALKELAPPEATFLSGDMQIFGQVFRSGRIPRYDGSTLFGTIRTTGITAGEELDYIIINPVIAATLPTEGLVIDRQQQQQFGRADQGILVAVVDDQPVDQGLDLKQLFNEVGREYFDAVQGFDPDVTQLVTNHAGFKVEVAVNPNKLNYKSSSGSLTIHTVERYNRFKKWQRGTGSIDYTVDAGKHTLHVEHDNIISGSHLNEEIVLEAFKTNPLNVFYDPGVTLSTTVINLLTLTSSEPKYVSGIRFNNTDIIFELSVTASNIFDYTYWEKPVVLSMEGTTLGEFVWNHSSSNLQGLTSPLWNDNFSLTNFVVNYNSPEETTTESVTLFSKAGKPSTGWGEETSQTFDILIDTYSLSGNSSPLRETFIDEEYRMQMKYINSDNLQTVLDNITHSWNSNVALSSDEAQQYMGSLQKAKDEYSAFGINVDYSSFADNNQEYFRMFYDVNERPNSNGNIKVVTNGVLGTDFEIHIKFPGLSAWLDVGTLFDNEIFVDSHTVDGTGCGTNSEKTNDGYILSWSAGTLSTANSGFGYLIKVIIKTNVFRITEILEISDNWS